MANRCNEKLVLDTSTRMRLIRDLYQKRALIKKKHFQMIDWLIHHRIFNIDIGLYQQLLQDLIECNRVASSLMGADPAEKAFLRLTKLLSFDKV